MAFPNVKTQNSPHYYRLQTLLIDGGTMVLRKVLDEKKSHSPLSVCLQHHQGTIKKVVNRTQYALMFQTPGAPSSNTFDISLLTCLLRIVCGLKGSKDPIWSTPPAQGDISTEADISRLRQFRNEVLTRLNSGLQNGVPNLTSVLATLKSAQLDPESEERLNQEIREWQKTDTATMRYLEEITEKMDEQTSYLNYITGEVEEERRQSTRTRENISIMTEKMDDLHISGMQSKAISVSILDRQDEISQGIKVVKEGQTNLIKQSSERQHNLQSSLTDMNIRIRGVESDVKAVSKRMDIPKITPEQKHLHDISQIYFGDAERKTDVYVKTAVHNEASEQLQKRGIAILSGHPGEGKSTMATHLLLEIAPVNKLLRLSGPTDWKLVHLDNYTAVLIDDIFGSGILDEQLLDQWEKCLGEIELVAKGKHMSFVITTRHYILQDAKDKLPRNEMFKDENITILSSSKLSHEEKHKMLEKHLKKSNRSVETSFLNDVEWPWKRKKFEYERTLPIGFPECAAMFAATDALFDKGFKFFSSPMEFFRKCLEDLSKKEDKFMALVFVWAGKSNRISVEDLEKKYPSSLQEIGNEFDYQLTGKSKKIKKDLDCHKDEFLLFDAKRGEYSFSHSVIRDVFGVVAADINLCAVIKYGSKDFIMKYVTTLPCSKDDMKVHVEEYRYPVLIDKLYQLLYERNDIYAHQPLNCSMRIREAGIENTRICSSTTTDRSILKHDAFRNSSFIESFVSRLGSGIGEDKIVNVPFLEVFEFFKAKFCIEFESDEMSMCLPSLLLAKGHTMMLDECMKHSILTEKEKYISLLLATRNGDNALVQKLISCGTAVSEDALQIAAINQDLNVLKLLLQNRKSLLCSSHIQNGSSPLIIATKRGCVKTVECLLQGGVDVNYRNKRNVSALDKAVIENNLELCRILLLHGARLNEKGGKFERTPLHTATDMEHDHLVNFFLQRGADIGVYDHRGEYPVHTAAVQGHTQVLRKLLEKDRSQGNVKMGPKRKGIPEGTSLFHFAVLNEKYELFEILREFCINPNIQDRYGRTPLYMAAFYGKSSFVKLLLDFADPQIPEKNGYTPLHAAVFKQHFDIIQLFCRCSNVNVNISEKRGYTPLHTACKSASTEIVKELLMNQDVDVRMITKKGETVFHILKKSSKNNTNWRTITKVSECIDAILQKDPGFAIFLEKV